MSKMTDDELRALTDAEMRQALGFYTGKLGQQRLKAMAYYLAEPKFDLSPPEVEGRSAVVSPDVRNTIESMMPALMAKFCSGDEIVSFEAQKPGKKAVGPDGKEYFEEERKAEQATDYINHLFYVRNDGERVAYNWMKDALLSKNGIIKVWWDERSEETREEYRGLNDWGLADLMDDEQVEITEQKSYPDEEDAEQRQKAIEQMSQQIPQAMEAAQQGNQQAAQAVQQIQAQIANIQQQPPKMLFDVVCKRVKKGGKVCVENVPPEEFLISRNAKSIETARFIGHRIARTASELESMGYKDVDQISGSVDTSTSMNMERIERLQFDDELAYNTNDQLITPDPSQRVIWVTECWVRVDFDGDGISELRRVVRAGDRILENDIVDVAPFVSITPVPMPHKFFGLSIADLLFEGQKINTMLLRGVLDNTWLQINGRYFAVDGQVNLDDLLTSRPGGVVRMKQAGMAGRLDQGATDSQLGMTMLEYMKGFNEDSSGWSRNSAGTDANALSDGVTATQAQIVTNKADMRVDLIARNFATGFRELFRLMLRLSAQYQSKEDMVKLRGQWVAVNPRDWANGFDTSINVGLGTGNKDQQVQHLLMLNQQQANGLAIGVSNATTIYNGLKELTKALGFKSPDKFFVDPSQNPVKPPADPEQTKFQGQMQLKQMELQHDGQKFQADMQLKLQANQQAHEARLAEIQKHYELQASNDQRDAQREQMKAAYDAQMAAAEQENARAIATMKAEIDKYKADLDAQTKLAIANMSAAPAIDMSGIESALAQVMEHMTAPVSIVRDPTGKAVGVTRGSITRQIQRGPDGRATGVQ